MGLCHMEKKKKKSSTLHRHGRPAEHPFKSAAVLA